MQISKDKYALVNESIFLPSFSLEAANSLSTFSVKISNKPMNNGKLSNLLEENPIVNPTPRHSILPPALPPYYYTSTFPSLFATLSPDHVRKPKGTSKENSIQHGDSSMKTRSNQLLANHKLNKTCTSEALLPSSLNNKSRKLILSPVNHQCRNLHDETDATKTLVTCLNNENDKILGEKNICCKKKKEKCVGDIRTEEDQKFICHMQHDIVDQEDQKSLKESYREQSRSFASSSGDRNRSMSLSSPKCLAHDETQFRRRRHSAFTVTHGENAPSQRRRHRATTSLGSTNKAQYNLVVRPTTSNTQHFLDRASAATPSTDRSKSKPKKGENEKVSKKQLNTSFERYYSAHLQANKAKINQRKAQHGNSIPKQTFWTHSSESKTSTKRNKGKTKLLDKSKTLQKLKDLKITADDETNNESNNSSEKCDQNEGKIAKGDASFKIKPTLLHNQTTQTNTTVIRRLSDKSHVSSTKSFKSFQFAPTPLLSPEQLVIRDSVEKVRRWMKSLPKHFDAIQQVLPPTQQDY